MAIHYHVLGDPGRDNGLFVRIDSGQRITRLLFDCGEGCLSGLAVAEIQAIDHLLFSHLHMDHVGGFDSFFRCNFGRDTKPNRIWGPPGTSAILHHRFQGYLWNLIDGQQASWTVSDIGPAQIERFRYELSDAFAKQHEDGVCHLTDSLIDDEDFEISAIPLSHHGISLGYLVRETPKVNVRKDRLDAMGLRPGPWMKDLKDKQVRGDVLIDGQSVSLDKLRAELLVASPGQAIAYLTDFLLDDATFEQLATVLRGCDVVVCEAQYRHHDKELAERNHHTTIKQVAELAAAADIGELVLFHLSDRYDRSEWAEMLDEGRASFGRISFPANWNLTSG